MDALIAAQTELSGRIARSVDNLRKSGAAKITSSTVQTTLTLLDKKWAKFEEQHDQLRSLHFATLQTHDYLKKDFLGQVEDLYVRQRSQLMELQLTLSPSTSEERRDSRNASSELSSARSSLPRIHLPQFTGRYEDWPTFRDLFTSMVIDESSLSDVERLHYLKTSLKGDAEPLIRTLPITTANFSRAWDIHNANAIKPYISNLQITA